MTLYKEKVILSVNEETGRKEEFEAEGKERTFVLVVEAKRSSLACNCCLCPRVQMGKRHSIRIHYNWRRLADDYI